MTQSGISQHIRKLETRLGQSLFFRHQNRMHLSPAGMELRRFVETYLDGVDSLLDSLGHEANGPHGAVTFATPENCLHTDYYSRFLDVWKRDFPKINLKIRVHSSEEIVDLALACEIDFGFITKPLFKPGIELEKFMDEEYVLVAAKPIVSGSLTLEALKTAPFIGYYGMDSFFDHWVKAEIPRGAKLSYKALNFQAEVDCIDPAILMVKKGLGVSIFPRWWVQQFIQRGELCEYRPRTLKTVPNQVFLLRAQGPPPTKRVRTVMDAFRALRA